MEKRRLTCIGCPMGCQLTVELDGEQIASISGYTCKRGMIYGEKEVTHPTRIVTTTVRVVHGTAQMVPVKTKEDVPKDKIFDCIRELKEVEIEAPVRAGEPVLKNVAGTGVDVIAVKSVEIQQMEHGIHSFCNL